MAKKGMKRTVLNNEEKLLKAVQALFVLHARKVDMGSEEIRHILGIDKAEVNAVAKIVNKALKKAEKS